MTGPGAGRAGQTDDVDDVVTSEKETTIVPVQDETERADEQASDEAGETADEATEATGEPAEDATEKSDQSRAGKSKRRVNWSRVLAFGVLPALVLMLAMAAGFLKWQDASVRGAEAVRSGSVQVAKDSTIALLSYEPDTVEQQLGAARDLLTGEFRGSYESLVNDVVIPGAKEQQISAAASIPAAASVSADTDHAVVLVFVNQTVTIGDAAPTDTASSVRVTLDKVDGRWLISQFEPV